MKILIDEHGTIRHLHDDALDLRDLGSMTRQRASHVEPDDETGGWYVDLQPSGGPVVKGFQNRSDALFYEKQWIEENVLNVQKQAPASRAILL